MAITLALKPWMQWTLWGGLTLGLAGFLTWKMIKSEDKTVFLPGDTTHGHYQIELDCAACHEPFGGVRQESCVECHGQDLKDSDDSHPKKKFTDPRNADRIAVLDATQCVTCHVEHNPDITHKMGVTMPLDYCFRCHEDIADDRPSHTGLGFDTCATAGCHNFHDNRALYEGFVAQHMDEPPIAAEPRVRTLTSAAAITTAVSIAPDMPATVQAETAVLSDWLASRHATAGVNCSDCHQAPTETAARSEWVDKPGISSCQRCHDAEADGFLQSRHGMRIAAGMTPMTPGMARLPMKADAAHETMDCNACHQTHRYDTKSAAATACMSCHDDTHTRAYQGSPHAALWDAEVSGRSLVGTGVSCATCHLPREERKMPDGSTQIRVQHNQNRNLRPNEKMIRSSCMTCHGLGFSIDSLADNTLIQNNFRGQPSVTIETIEWIRRRVEPKTP